jgi:hypothetical protein
MKTYLVMTIVSVFFALLPSESWLSQNVLNPWLWAQATGFALIFLGGQIRGENDPVEGPPGSGTPPTQTTI